MKKQRKGKSRPSSHARHMRCDYCGSPVQIRQASEIHAHAHEGQMAYVCGRYPTCDSYVHAHPGTNLPMGSLANRQLRRLRQEAHRAFNAIYESGIMSKTAAYTWLSDIIQGPKSEAHIGHLREYYCRQVIQESKKLLEARGMRARNDPRRKAI